MSGVADANVAKIPSPFSGSEHIKCLGGRRVVETLSLIIKEEEQLILDYRAPDCAAEHIPAKRRLRQGLTVCIDPFEPVLPLIRVQLVVAEVLP